MNSKIRRHVRNRPVSFTRPENVSKPLMNVTPTEGTTTASEAVTEPLNTLTVPQLRTMARERGLTGYSGMRKADLIAALS
jgi:large subunit ribosomal protein L21